MWSFSPNIHTIRSFQLQRLETGAQFKVTATKPWASLTRPCLSSRLLACLVVLLSLTSSSLPPQVGVYSPSSSVEGTLFSSLTRFYLFIFISIYLFGCARSSLQHVRSSSLARDQTLGSLHGEHRVLATGPPGKSLLSPDFSKTKQMAETGC